MALALGLMPAFLLVNDEAPCHPLLSLTTSQKAPTVLLLAQ